MQPLAVHFLLKAADMQRAVSFYQNILGFYPLVSNEQWSELGYRDVTIWIKMGNGDVPSRSGLTIQYDDLDHVYELCLVAGAEGLEAPSLIEKHAMKTARIRDPEGNEITLIERLPKEDDGTNLPATKTKKIHRKSGG
ncbi:VOC family protein [Sulfuriroseicoccus oceanibius]|uniref:VOC family protein n=1 Tax=Sulfuriroseicoccus oceanibius TaxID=2707525 RepID=A0A6B3LEV1_9BACT|nr:VOC family protein [Sulfuriroseicoccus oceanibius]QQL45206.1 VOC family protein [Sulfuriroseicoccus oceanibius]